MLFAVPFSKEYWRQAFKAVKDIRVLTVCAMCMALSLLLGRFRIPVGENLKIGFTFLATATAGIIAGPVMALIYGAAVDIIDFFLNNSGGYPFFFGYTLSAMLGALVYALFFYRARITLLRLALCRIIINYGVNVALGSVWSAMMYSKGYMYYFYSSLIKNTAMLPIEVLMMYLFFTLLLPAMASARLIPREQKQRIKLF